MILLCGQYFKKDCQREKEEGDRKKCYWVGYWKQETVTSTIHISRNWHKSEQDRGDENDNLPTIAECNKKEVFSAGNS